MTRCGSTPDGVPHIEATCTPSAPRRAHPCRFLVLLAVVVEAGLDGCDRARPRMDAVAPGVPPFAAIGDVRLGMQAEELRSARPTVVPVAYVGYAEQVDGRTVTYHLTNQEAAGRTDSPRNGRLDFVEAAVPLTQGGDPAAVWASVLATLQARLGTPPRCYASARMIPPHTLALWDRGAGQVYALFVSPGRLVVGVADPASRTFFAGQRLVPRACTDSGTTPASVVPAPTSFTPSGTASPSARSVALRTDPVVAAVPDE